MKTESNQVDAIDQKELVAIPKQPPFGWGRALAKECGVSLVTVTRAIRYNTAGVKSELVRAKYRELYMNDK